jgi:hypothetical protein
MHICATMEVRNLARKIGVEALVAQGEPLPPFIHEAAPPGGPGRQGGGSHGGCKGRSDLGRVMRFATAQGDIGKAAARREKESHRRKLGHVPPPKKGCLLVLEEPLPA